MTAEHVSVLQALNADRRRILADHKAQMAACAKLSASSGKSLGELQTMTANVRETIAISHQLLTVSRAHRERIGRTA
jgi:hypothetical protein